MKIGVRMNIYYCEICGIRIPNDEVDKAQSSAGYVRHCSKCTPKGIFEPSQKQIATTKASTVVRKLPVPHVVPTPKRRSNQAIIWIIAIPSVLLGLLVFKSRKSFEGETEPTIIIGKPDEPKQKPTSDTQLPPIVKKVPAMIDKPTTECKISIPPKLAQKETVVLYRLNFDKDATGPSGGERIGMDDNFVLKMETIGRGRRCEIAAWNPANQGKLSFTISDSLFVSFRLNPGTSTRIGVRCFIDNGQSYSAYLNTKLNAWESHVVPLSKLKTETFSAEMIPMGARLKSFVVYTMDKSDAYIDDIVIYNDPQ
jgi:hypothetical protein